MMFPNRRKHLLKLTSNTWSAWWLWWQSLLPSSLGKVLVLENKQTNKQTLFVNIYIISIGKGPELSILARSFSKAFKICNSCNYLIFRVLLWSNKSATTRHRTLLDLVGEYSQYYTCLKGQPQLKTTSIQLQVWERNVKLKLKYID